MKQQQSLLIKLHLLPFFFTIWKRVIAHNYATRRARSARRHSDVSVIWIGNDTHQSVVTFLCFFLLSFAFFYVYVIHTFYLYRIFVFFFILHCIWKSIRDRIFIFILLDFCHQQLTLMTRRHRCFYYPFEWRCSVADSGVYFFIIYFIIAHIEYLT